MAAPFYNLKRHVQGIDDEDDLFSEESESSLLFITLLF